MGILHFFNLNDFISKYNLKVFIETGTGRGNGVAYARDLTFEKIYSFELLVELYKVVKEKYIGDERINLMLGSSISSMKKVLPKIDKDKGILFWLDAHFPGKDEVENPKELDVCTSLKLPLEEELRYIKEIRKGCKDVILIDDIKIYMDGQFELGNLPDRDNSLNLNFINELFEDSHKSTILFNHDGYMIIEPK